MNHLELKDISQDPIRGWGRQPAISSCVPAPPGTRENSGPGSVLLNRARRQSTSWTGRQQMPETPPANPRCPPLFPFIKARIYNRIVWRSLLSLPGEGRALASIFGDASSVGGRPQTKMVRSIRRERESCGPDFSFSGSLLLCPLLCRDRSMGTPHPPPLTSPAL